MKKILTTLALTAVCVGAIAQGKITFVNDSVHSYYFSADANFVKADDASMVGKLTSGGLLAGSGITLRTDLYGGTSADSMTLQTSTTLSATPGRQSTSTFLSPTLPGGVMAYFQVQIRDAAYATAALAEAAHSYYGYSMVFTMSPSATTAGASIVNANSPFFSTWAAGTVDLGSQVAGYRGAIEIKANPVPEPTSMALAGLGAASLLIFRRRK
jgi:hypothetical protein